MTNTINAHTNFVIWLRSHRCYEMANMHNQRDSLYQGNVQALLLELTSLPSSWANMCAAVIDTMFNESGDG